jgi:urea transport system ATP-binding protein
MLILDEPTEGIQPSVVSEIEKIILSLTSRGGISALLVEQHVGFALAAASRYYVMEAGHVTSAGAGGTDAHNHVRTAMAI